MHGTRACTQLACAKPAGSKYAQEAMPRARTPDALAQILPAKSVHLLAEAGT
jgi:hypothetical protein